ncbi:MAG: sulfite exporter TauE/SafE family protein [Firmicutes bacterium]|jgi:uncharacterized membrane protein YfcA|nr:sulfite exporter TauE/SafE family protein [Bacillota bacterium]MCL5971600.1 sulfite exporter TauE/SafE family protein [Bacillota bacterium]
MNDQTTISHWTAEDSLSTQTPARYLKPMTAVWVTSLGITGVVLGLGLATWLPQISLWTRWAEYFAIGSLVGLVASWLGLGGSIMLVPALLSLPGNPLSSHQISTAAALQTTFVAGIGYLSYRRLRYVVPKLWWQLGSLGAVGAALGALLSRYWYPLELDFAFAFVSLLAALSLFVPRRVGHSRVPHPGLFAITVAIGIIGGITGMPGSFILTPVVLMTTGLSLRQCLGTVLGAVFVMALVSSVIKVASQEVVWLPTLALLAGAIPMSWIGPRLAAETPTRWIRVGLFVAIISATILTVSHVV